MTPASDTARTGVNRRVILNPQSGGGKHAPKVRRLAAERGYSLVETEAAGDAVELGKKAATDGITVLAACGGDGTVQEVVRGLAAADALDAVRFGILPAGTANVVAGDIGVRSIEHGFSLLEIGEARDIDIGFADDIPFIKSCIAGLTASTSAATTSEMKSRFGPLAFFITGIRQSQTFDGLELDIDATTDEGRQTWSGTALSVLVGNARRFTRGLGQANVEDGLFTVTIVKQIPASSMVAEAITQQLFRRDTENVTHLKAERLTIESTAGEIDFSLDGEIHTRDRLGLRVRPAALTICVGPTYEPDPPD